MCVGWGLRTFEPKFARSERVGVWILRVKVPQAEDTEDLRAIKQEADRLV